MYSEADALQSLLIIFLRMGNIIFAFRGLETQHENCNNMTASTAISDDNQTEKSACEIIREILVNRETSRHTRGTSILDSLEKEPRGKKITEILAKVLPATKGFQTKEGADHAKLAFDTEMYSTKERDLLNDLMNHLVISDAPLESCPLFKHLEKKASDMIVCASISNHVYAQQKEELYWLQKENEKKLEELKSFEGKVGGDIQHLKRKTDWESERTNKVAKMSIGNAFHSGSMQLLPTGMMNRLPVDEAFRRSMGDQLLAKPGMKFPPPDPTAAAAAAAATNEVALPEPTETAAADGTDETPPQGTTAITPGTGINNGTLQNANNESTEGASGLATLATVSQTRPNGPANGVLGQAYITPHKNKE